MLFCGIDGMFMGIIDGFEKESDGKEFVYFHYHFNNEVVYDTHCLTPGYGSPVFIICPW